MSVKFKWYEITEAMYSDALNVLPPMLWTPSRGFLVMEPVTDRKCTLSGKYVCTFSAFLLVNGKYYGGPDLTRQEFIMLNPPEAVKDAVPLPSLHDAFDVVCSLAVGNLAPREMLDERMKQRVSLSMIDNHYQHELKAGGK
jgi:hypothetical protein